MVSAWPEPQNVKLVGVHDGMEALACNTTETRPNRSGEEESGVALAFPSSTLPGEDFTVAETTKLSVGQALEKLRGNDAPKAKMVRLDEKIETLDKETQRLRAMRHRLERDQRAGSTGRVAQEANVRRVTKLKISGIIIGLIIVIPVLAWTWGLL